MKKSIMLISFAVLIVLIATMFALTSSAAVPAKVIYISADGKGDGSTPESPLGNDPDYKPCTNGTHVKNAFYKAYDEINESGGTIVIVGPISIDTAASRTPTTSVVKNTPSEFELATPWEDGFFNLERPVITITSVYGGVDYRTKGAALILDHDVCNVTMLMFKNPMTIDNLNIDYRYNSKESNAWGVPFMIGFWGHTSEVGEGVNVTSFDVAENKAGDVFPIVMGGHRYSSLSDRGTDLRVKGGTWSQIIGGSYGMSSNNYGNITKSINLNVGGNAKADYVIGTNTIDWEFGKASGDVNIKIDGKCEIGELYFVNKSEYLGKSIHVELEKDAKVTVFDYAPEGYLGNIKRLKERVVLVNKQIVEDETTPPVTTAPVTTAEPAGTTGIPGSAASPETTGTSTAPTDEGGIDIDFIVGFIVGIFLAAVIALIVSKYKKTKKE